jgi:hypothetical protein
LNSSSASRTTITARCTKHARVARPALESYTNPVGARRARRRELYLRWLDRHERQPSEAAPLGIILGAGKKRETVEYPRLDDRGIHVAEYITELPPRELLEQRLHRAISAARGRLAIGATRKA